MPGIFISYRRKDAGGYAGRLHQDLVHRYGRSEVFMDIDSIGGGQDFRRRIHDALDSSDIALILIGEAWTATSAAEGEVEPRRRIDDEDDLVRREVAGALRHDTVTVVPVLVEDAMVPDSTDLPDDLSSLPDLQVRRLRNGEWRTDFERICATVDRAGHESWWTRSVRRARGGMARPKVMVSAVLALVALAALVIALSGGSPSSDCTNRFIPPSARMELSAAAHSARPALKESVFYGSCGSRTFALAAFPDGSDGAFVESDLHWVDLGPIAAAKCERVPSGLLDAWGQDDC